MRASMQFLNVFNWHIQQFLSTTSTFYRYDCSKIDSSNSFIFRFQFQEALAPVCRKEAMTLKPEDEELPLFHQLAKKEYEHEIRVEISPVRVEEALKIINLAYPVVNHFLRIPWKRIC